MLEPSGRQGTTRRIPVPVSLPSGRVGRGHLLPDLSFTGPRSGFIRVPGGKRVNEGMVAFVGESVGVSEMLERWEREIGPVADQEAARALLGAYIEAVATLKLGSVVSVEYPLGGGLELKTISETPPGGFRPKLPR